MRRIRAGQMLGWTPGQNPRPSPDDMAWRLEPGSDFVAQLHLQPTGKPEAVQVSVAFFFTDQAPTRTPVGLRLGSETIDIPPGDAHFAVVDRYVLPVDAELLAVQPHAHNLARTMEATAELPGGQTRSLIAIADWDFRWQDVYRYTQPIALPKGTVLSMRYIYDNSAANPRNPFRPPERIVWGQNTSNEMGDLWLQLVPRSNRDLMTLANDIGQKTRAEDLAAYTKIMQADPDNPLRHDTVAMLNLQMGRVSEAIAEFSESLRLNPESAPTHYNLGLAFSLQRQYDRAMAEFQNAVRLDPNHADAHNNLGAMFHATGQFDLAAEHYRRAFAIRPENVEAHNNLGAAAVGCKGSIPRRSTEFERALALNPEFAQAVAGLAWIRATASDESVRQSGEAIQLAERAAELSGRRDPSILDTLAAAYASAAQFEKASATAREAMALADAARMQDLWVDIRSRLQLYERGQPYRVR